VPVRNCRAVVQNRAKVAGRLRDVPLKPRTITPSEASALAPHMVHPGPRFFGARLSLSRVSQFPQVHRRSTHLECVELAVCVASPRRSRRVERPGACGSSRKFPTTADRAESSIRVRTLSFSKRNCRPSLAVQGRRPPTKTELPGRPNGSRFAGGASIRRKESRHREGIPAIPPRDGDRNAAVPNRRCLFDAGL